MRLVEVLATGVRGAESGTVEIYRRGTSTFATVYSDYKGGGAQTPTAGLALDTNGGREIYVDGEVDCIVKSSTSATVRTFTVMGTASTTEVRSQSFTGTDYDTALSAASYPVALDTLLDKWKTSAGTLDFNVLLDGVATALSTAIGNFSGIFYNVKATAYGAKGDNTTDDTSAIQAALTAAGTAGGGIVVFPKGTYRVVSALTIPSGVSLWGVGSLASIVTIDHAANNLLSYSASTTYPVEMRGLRLEAKQANTGKIVVVESGTKLTIINCYIGNMNTNGRLVSYGNASTTITMIASVLQLGTTGSEGIAPSAVVAAKIVLIGNRFIAPATLVSMVYIDVTGGGCWVIGNHFDCSGSTAGSGFALELGCSGYAVVGNRFEAPASGTGRAIDASIAAGTQGKYFAANSFSTNAFAVSGNSYSVTTSTSSHEGAADQSREVRQYHVSTNSTPITVDANFYGCAEVRRTTNANQTINVSGPASPGLLFMLTLNNDQAGVSGTITMGASVKGQAPFTVIANNVRHIMFRSVENMAAGGGSAAYYWSFVGTSADVTP